MPAQIRVSLRRLFAWTTIYAILLGVLTMLPLLPLQLFAAIVIISAFVVADSLFDWKHDTVPATARLAMVVAYYASALAAIAAACYLLYLVLPEPPTPPPPSTLSFWGSVFQLLSLPRDLGDAISRAATIVLIYLIAFGVFSTIALTAAIVARRQYPAAKWFALANGPGTCLLLLIVAFYFWEIFWEST